MNFYKLKRIFKKVFFFLIITILLWLCKLSFVNAATLEDKIIFNPSISTIGGKRFDDINAYYTLNAGQSETLAASLKFDIKDTSNLSMFPDEQTYYYMTFNYCSTGNKTFTDIYSSYDNKIFDIVKTGVKCKPSAGTDGDLYIMFVQMKLSFFDDDDTGAYAYRLYFQPSFGLRNYLGYQFFIRNLDARILSYDNFVKTYNSYSSISNQVKIIDQNKNIINNGNATNKKLDDLNKNLTDETSPNLNGLQNSAGWLKPGPVDSIVNLPLTLLNNLQTNLGNTCNPVTVKLPYVNKDINLPCISAIYKQINGLDTWFQGIGVIAAAFILYRYFMYLYNRIDDTLSFRENNMQGYFDDSLWGGM